MWLQPSCAHPPDQGNVNFRGLLVFLWDVNFLQCPAYIYKVLQSKLLEGKETIYTKKCRL